MFVLVLWTETSETSIVDYKSVKESGITGTKVKYGKKWYPARIIEKSGEYDETIFSNVNFICDARARIAHGVCVQRVRKENDATSARQSPYGL